MRLRSLATWPSHLAMAAFFGVFATYYDLFVEVTGGLPIPILAVNLCLMVLAGLAAGTFLKAAAFASVRSRLIGLFRSHVMVLLPLGALVSASFASAFLRTSFLDIGPRYVLYPAYSAAVIVFSMLLPVPEHRRQHFRWYFFIAFAIAVAGVLTDVVRPGTFSMLPDRAAGFPQNPNTGGFVVITLLCGVLSFERIRALDLLSLVGAAAAVLATLSRGAMILLAFVVGCYTVSIVWHARQRGMRALLGPIIGLVLLVVVAAFGASFLIEQRMFASPGSRIDMLLGREQVVGPRESRVALLQSSWDLVRQSPVFGYGSGFTSTMRPGPHNIYISRWLDDGLLGLTCYVWLIAAIGLTFWKRRYTNGIVYASVLAMEGFFNHNMLEERAFLVLSGVLLTLSYFAATESVAATSASRASDANEVVPARRPGPRRTASPPLSA